MQGDISRIAVGLPASLTGATPVQAGGARAPSSLPALPSATTIGYGLVDASATTEVRVRLAANRADLGAALDGLASAARGVRERSGQLQRLEQSLQGARDALQFIVKNFPPLPLDSRERAEKLEAYASYRQLVASLTLTPLETQWPPAFGRETEPGGDAAEGPRVALADGQFLDLPPKLNLASETIDTGLPELGDLPSDAAVAAVVEQLDARIAQVAGARVTLLEGFGFAVQDVALSGEGLAPPVGQLADESSQRLREALALAGFGLTTPRKDDSPLVTA